MARLDWSALRTPALVLLASVILGIVVVQAGPFALLLPVVALVLLAPAVSPVWGVGVLVVYLLAQDPLQILAGRDTQLAMAVKRSEEFLLLALAVLYTATRPEVRQAFRFRRLYLPVVGCFVAMLLSSAVAGTALVPAGVDLALFSKPFLLLALGLAVPIRLGVFEPRLRQVLLALVALQCFAIVFLLMPAMQEAYLGGLRRLEIRLGVLCAQGTFIEPATYAWFCAAGFCLAYAGYLAFSRRLYLVLAVISSAFVVLSWRRKSILAVAFVLLVSLAIRIARHGRRRAAQVLVIAVLAGCLILAPYLSALTTRTLGEYASSDPYANARSALYYTSLIIARDHFPLGTGLASFGSFASRLFYSETYYQYGIGHIDGISPRHSSFITDTYWPMVLGEGGILCLVSFLAFLGTLFWTAKRTAADASRPPATVFLSLATLFLLVGSFSESMASHAYGSSLHAALVFLPAGMWWRRIHLDDDA